MALSKPVIVICLDFKVCINLEDYSFFVHGQNIDLEALVQLKMDA